MSDPDLYSPDPWRREAARIRQQNAQRQRDSWNKPKNHYQGSGKVERLQQAMLQYS
ncbi:MAG: hypothetical protein GW903_00385 [Alphaproteobacteria bacterium]|nr:hypothetical protein [Alphaproteobacteria bacterium]NCQ87428.1 hypothetical protein [Alphaproteobacteria bacterium]NCT06299.1 hypothetical protein [Alphaproteobacteria bacterium]